MGKSISGASGLLLLYALTGVCASGVATQSLTATINPAWSLTAPASLGLTRGAHAFDPFQATLPVNYRARTTPAGGGKITLQVTADFAPAGGPSAARGGLTYTCGSAGLGTGCPGVQTASPTSQTTVVNLPASGCTGGGGGCSSQDPNSLLLTFNLLDDPAYATGTYSATLTFTISAI